MTKEKALEIITNVTEQVSLSYRDHLVIKEALELLATLEVKSK